MCTSCPSPTPFGLGLGPTDPGTINVAQETLDLRRAGFSPAFALLVPAFALVLTPHGLPFVLRLLRTYDARLPTSLARRSMASVHDLSPDHFRRHFTRPVSYYALFERWLLLSQLPGCLCKVTSFAT